MLHDRIGPGMLELGYRVDVRRTRHGVATLAAAALTDLAIGAPEVQAVEIHHDQANRASGANPIRLGYSVAATINDVPAGTGEVGAEQQGRMTRSSWPLSNGAYLPRRPERALRERRLSAPGS